MKNLLLFVFLSLLAQTALAQEGNEPFYYTTSGSEPVYLTIVTGKYVVEFPEGIETPENPPGEWLNTNYYLVTDSSELGQYASNYIVRHVYADVDGNEMYATGELVVKFLEGVTQNQKTTLLGNNNLLLVSTGGVFDVYKSSNEIVAAKNVFESDLVAFAHPNFIIRIQPHSVPNDTYFVKQFYFHNTGQLLNDGHYGTADADIDAPEAWDISKGNSSIIIAVNGDGVESDHYDLPNTRQVRLPGSNILDPTNPNDPSPSVDAAHETGCAGIIAGTQDNNIGITGIAPLCKVMPVRVYNDGLGGGNPTAAQVANSITFCDTNGAQIISNSIGYNTANPNIFPVIKAAIESALANKKVVIFSVGNTANPDSGNYGYVQFPANSGIPGLISVGASDRNDMQSVYSPVSPLIDIVAPSHKAYSCHYPNDNYPEVWTTDLYGLSGYNPWGFGTWPNPCLGVAGGWTEQLPPLAGPYTLSFTGRFGGTSAAAPQVAGVAALILSVNDCLNPTQIKEILLQTTDKVGGYDYDWDVSKPGHSKEMGYGRLNAHKAVKAAQDMKKTTLDLYVKDDILDLGIEPNTQSQEFWVSPDIWVRNQDDDIEEHQNPEYSTISPVIVHVKVRNKSCVDAPGSIFVKLYWAKAGPYHHWPAPYDGSVTTPSPIPPYTPVPIGGHIATLTPLGGIPAGESKIIKFEWNVPDPSTWPKDFVTAGSGPPDAWHFCLMAEIVSTLDPNPINTNTQVPTGDLLRQCNNYAMKNISVVNFHGDKPGERRNNGGTITIGNLSDQDRSYTFHFDALGYSHSIVDEAEVILTLDDAAWTKWLAGGQQGTSVSIYNRGYQQLRITDAHATLANLSFQAGELCDIDVQFNFVTDYVTDHRFYKYLVGQRYTDEEGEHTVGEQLYQIHRYDRDLFDADAGSDKAINKYQSTTLNATDILETAVYNWYDETDSLIYTGKNLTVSPEITRKYKLEIVADIDGFKSYDEVQVNVKKHFITAISPNPTTNQFVLQYDATDANSSYIMILESFGQTVNNYILNPLNTQQTINVAGYQPGIYTVVLVCDGQVADTKTVSIY